MSDRDRYLLVDTTQPAWGKVVRDECRAHHKRAGAHREISVTMNVAGTRALVKVRGGRRAWRDGRAWKGIVLAVYNRESIKRDFWPEFYSPAWQPPDEE